MSNQAIETVNTGADKAKIAVAVLVFIGGIVAYYLLEKQPGYVRVGVVLAGLAVGAVIGLLSGPGQRLIAFAKDSWAETKRVVWPDRKETTQTTLIVFAFVVATAVFLWIVDKLIEWSLYDLILNWK